MIKEIAIKTEMNDLVFLNDLVNDAIKESGIQEGDCLLYCPHTTAAIVVTSKMDPAGFEDLKDETNRLVPTRIDFKHQFDTPTDASGHIKSTLFGVSLPLIVSGGKLLVGSSQGIYFAEYDGPRKRKVVVKITADK